MSDLIVLICILWATAMTGVAFHYFVLYNKSVKAGTRLMLMLIGLGTGATTLVKNDDGSFVFENDEHKMVFGRAD